MALVSQEKFASLQSASLGCATENGSWRFSCLWVVVVLLRQSTCLLACFWCIITNYTLLKNETLMHNWYDANLRHLRTVLKAAVMHGQCNGINHLLLLGFTFLVSGGGGTATTRKVLRVIAHAGLSIFWSTMGNAIKEKGTCSRIINM